MGPNVASIDQAGRSRRTAQPYSDAVNPEQQGPTTGGHAGGRVPWQVRVAGGLVGVEAIGGLGFAVALAVRGASTAAPLGLVLGQSAFFGLIGVVLVAVSRGLVRGRYWARTPAIVTQLLLLPVAFSLIGPSRQVVIGLVVGAAVGACFLLLVGAAARRWADAEGG